MSWPPSQPPNDCFQGFCSIDCPQWCYFLLAPPPPPFDLTTSGGSGSEFSPRTVSPIVIAIIAVTAATLLLLGYYITYKYWQQLHRPRWRPSFDGAEVGGAWWHSSLPVGLDQSLINRITMCSYRKGDGLVGAPNCSVCLSEFREDESLRLLPNCGHAFHAQCIDTWLKFHPNCPLCRAGIVSAAPPVGLPAPHEPEGDRRVEVSNRANEVAVQALQDSETSIRGSNGEAPKRPLESLCDVGGVQERYHVIDFRDDRIQPVTRSLSIGSSCRGLDSIANDDYEGRAKSGEGSPVFEGMAASSTGCRGEEH